MIMYFFYGDWWGNEYNKVVLGMVSYVFLEGWGEVDWFLGKVISILLLIGFKRVC